MELTLDNYFPYLNSLSLNIARDINRVKSTYDQETWHSLTLNDQENVLNNFFIKPDLYNKYNNKCITERASQVKTNMVYSYNGQDLHTYIYQNVGMKMLYDENHAGNCRDEHSFPFSYRTKSQINIPSIESIRAATTLIDVSKSIKSEAMNNTKKPSIININEALPHYKGDEDLITNSVGQHDNDQQNNETSHVESKNTILIDSDNEFKESSGPKENDKLLSPDLYIPRGFDFLSNW
ncbi:uncharacterized protein [Drosophila kikkawai]|uniref:DUF4706 domain-containing protein n=1 Tax=Drosophila kikkawai TaxID=30033 RepID=A0ABM3C7G0_DROKI|nr:uncharacterized protein LOC108086041 [Drosophila kikkawai]XP_041632631.1 uncharacterized protein LOC108086041 [Drosophila kikkawai]XP_041632632.1 uncharacterized protein LOC108086041 [Drosophila kikkawai]